MVHLYMIVLLHVHHICHLLFLQTYARSVLIIAFNVLLKMTINAYNVKLTISDMGNIV